MRFKNVGPLYHYFVRFRKLFKYTTLGGDTATLDLRSTKTSPN